MKKHIWQVLSILIVMAMLIGCTSAPAAESAPPASEGAATAAPESAAAPAEATAPAKTSLTLATAGEPLRFYGLSSKGSAGDDMLVLNNVYDSLVFLESDGKLSPSLAESWEISEDKLCYTFHLREGVKFHDGSDFTADDVQFSLEQGKISPLGGALLINYDHCEIVDAHTIKVFLSKPYAAFLNCLSSRVAYMVSKDYYEKVGEEGYMTAPIGTGAYKFVSAVSGDTITLEAFDDYWRGKPAIQTVYIKTMTDTSSQIIALENGDVDAVRNPAISACTKLDASKGVTWMYGPTVGRVTLYLAAWGGSACEDINVRKAIQAGIDKENVNIGVTEGYGSVLDIDICPSYSGCPTGYKVVKHDADKAKEYLAASGYNGQEISILTKVGSSLETAARIVQASLMEIGINCTVNAVDGATYYELYGGGNYDAVMVDALSSLVDADGFILHFQPPESKYVYSQHVTYDRKAEIYDLCLQGRATEGEARKELYRQAVDISTDEAYLVPLYNGVVTVAYNEGLKGVTAHCLGSYNLFQWSW